MSKRVVGLALGLMFASGAEAAEWRAIVMFSHLTSASLVSVTDMKTGATHYEKCHLKTTERLSIRELDAQIREMHPSNCLVISEPVMIDGNRAADSFNSILGSKLRKIIATENESYAPQLVNGIAAVTGTIATVTMLGIVKLTPPNTTSLQRMGVALRGVMTTPFPYIVLGAAAYKAIEGYYRSSEEYTVESLLPRLKDEVIGRRSNEVTEDQKTEVLKIMEYFEKALGAAAADFNAA